MTTHSRRTSWLLALLVLCSCATASAQAQGPLKARMSVSYQGVAIASVFKALASALGCGLQLDPRVSGTVTLEVRHVSAETVLRAVCEGAGCRWRLDRGQLVVDLDPAADVKAQPDPYAEVRVADVHQDIPAHILWNDAPLDAAAKTFAKMLDAQLLLEPDLASKRISLDQNRGTAWSALNAACQQASCRWRMVSEPQRRLLFVADSTSTFEASLPAHIARVGQAGLTAPALVSAPKPRYTESARRAKTEGVVEIECVVLEDGTVGQVRLLRSLDKVTGLDLEAVMAAKLHVFQPGRLAGHAVPVVVGLSITFALRT
jgi:TonB family protein